MNNLRAWKGFFLFAALFNASAGLPMVFAPTLFGQLMLVDPEAIAASTPWIHQFGVLVLGFGLAYYWISRDPLANRNLVLLGCIGKLGVFFTAWVDYFNGSAPLPFAVLVVADALFAIVFYHFYRSSAAWETSGKTTKLS